MNLLNSFYRVKSLAASKLIFESDEYEYSYVVPEEYTGKKIKIILSGGGGGVWAGSNLTSDTYSEAGNAELLEYIIESANGQSIDGILGRSGLANVTSSSIANGGLGYDNGRSGVLYTTMSTAWHRGGGGGGSSSLNIDGEFVLEASGGGGMIKYFQTNKFAGGLGGGPNGGSSATSAGNGLGAKGAVKKTGSGAYYTPAEQGYIKIYLLPN